MGKRADIVDLIALMLPLGIGVALFKDKILRILGLKDTLIVYYNYADHEAAKTLQNFLGYRADMVLMSPSITSLPPEADEYKYIILLGGQTVNPIYRKYVQMGLLPEVTETNRIVIKVIGNLIFIAGYEREDTFEAVSKFIQQLQSQQF